MFAGPSQVASNRRATSPQGFTLVELLVVISLIALLIALLLPAMSKAIASARLAKCLSDKKQLSLCAFLYGNDYKDRVPTDTNYTNWVAGTDKAPMDTVDLSNNSGWMLTETTVRLYPMGSLALRQYVTDPSLFHCADFPRYVQTRLIPSWADSKVAFDRPEFASTWRNMSNGGNSFPGQVGGSVVHYFYSGNPVIPKLTFGMISDNWQANTTYGARFTPFMFSGGYLDFGGQYMQAHNGERMNTVFIDGSAKGFNMTEIKRKYFTTLGATPENNGGQNATILNWARLKTNRDNRP